MLGRSKTPRPGAPTPEPVKPGGKGRPTPRRSQAQARNRTPLVGAGRGVKPGATKEERKAARTARRTAVAAERAKTRQALFTGDERHLPARDRGPVRRFARDYVDARRSVGEFFLPTAVVVIMLSVIPVPALQVASIMLLYGTMLTVIIDSIVLRRRLKRLTEDKFGADKAAGAPTYGMMRALQLRRTRMPRPQVPRGHFPS